MKRRRGIHLVGSDHLRVVSGGEPPTTEHLYRVEVWSDSPEAGGEQLEVIARCTDVEVSMSAWKTALRRRPGKTLIHLNGSHRMACQRAEDPPPLSQTADGAGSAETNDRDKRVLELPGWIGLVGCCTICDHRQSIDRRALVRRLGDRVTIAQLGAKLKCRECGNRSGNRVITVKLPR